MNTKKKETAFDRVWGKLLKSTRLKNRELKLPLSNRRKKKLSIFLANEYAIQPTNNPLYPLSPQECFEIIKSLSIQEINNLGFDDYDDFYEYIDMIFTINEKQPNHFACEDINQFISAFRKLYYSGKRKTFRMFMTDVEELADVIND